MDTPMSESLPPGPPDPPEGIGAAGLRLWSHLTEFGPEEHELALIVEAVRTVDLLELLEEDIRANGAVVDSPQGRKANPAAVEARQQRITLARILAALRIPGEDDPHPTSRRQQRRAGARGVYSVDGGVT